MPPRDVIQSEKLLLLAAGVLILIKGGSYRAYHRPSKRVKFPGAQTKFCMFSRMAVL